VKQEKAMNETKILVVDDDSKIQKFLEQFLSREGFIVNVVGRGTEVLGQFELFKPDLLLLDVMMPGLDGFEVCRMIREKSDIPIIFLSAKDDAMDKIMGLTIGCDDYLTKPFESTELLLRVKAVLRRSSGNTSNSEKNQRDIINLPDLVINRSTRLANSKGKDVELTPKEFDLLWLLANRPEQVFTREQLLYQIWDSNYYGDQAVVTTLVKRLREKIEPDITKPIYIKTVHGIGYKLGVKPC
jgi:DNA-binding response OmpR family regulator